MKLMTEQVDVFSNKCLVEESDAGKKYFIEGVFMEVDQRNKNGRIYPKGIVASQLKEFNKNFIDNNRALGELGHPASPTVNLDRVSHNIISLKLEGNVVIGKAKLLNTPLGNIAKNLIDEGIQLAVSSRGLGSVKLDESGVNVVQSDFYLAAVDLVADPSAPTAFVNGIYEGVEYFMTDSGFQESVKRELDDLYRTTKADTIEREAKLLKIFEAALHGI